MLTYPAWRSIALELRKLCVPPLLLVCLWAGGCGGGSAPPAPPQPATILTQPMNDTVMVGQTAQFSVTASGTAPLTYQWNKNGSPIQGATSSTYATPATVENDTGSDFTVTVSNSLGSVTSNSAGLLVLTQSGPAPMAGDLRFRQIDAPATVNGYLGQVNPLFEAPAGFSFPAEYGTPLSVGVSCAGPTGVTGNCVYAFTAYYLPQGVTGLSLVYQTDYYSNFNANLSAVPAGNCVVNSLDLEQSYDAYGLSWQCSDAASGFDTASHTILPSSFQTAASQEGSQGRVITALSFDAGNLTYLSYGWQSDASTIYEVDVESATLDNFQTVASNLASNGYILTAIGGESTDGLLLVGTRVKGNTTPRPLRFQSFLNPPPVQMNVEGYAIVGLVNTPAGDTIWVGER
jgi:hypothetical protein